MYIARRLEDVLNESDLSEQDVTHPSKLNKLATQIVFQHNTEKNNDKTINR